VPSRGFKVVDFESKPKGLSRKGLLLGLGAGAAAAAAATVGGASDAALDSRPVVGGPIRAVFPPSRLQILDSNETTVDVTLTPDAHIARDRVVPLAAFAIGEDVVAEGRWAGSTFLANSLTSVYLPFKAPVVSVGREHVETKAGRVRFIAETRLQDGTTLTPVSPDHFQAGSELKALVRRDPRNDELIAVRVA
jgi:hypothetical protein